MSGHKRQPGAEGVVVISFWDDPIIFHRRGGRPGPWIPTPCGKRTDACGHIMPRPVAEQIAQPCKRCYPPPSSAIDG